MTKNETHWGCTTPACRTSSKSSTRSSLDDLRERLEEAGDNNRKLLNLRNRIARIRVFDPACGSGNFLVIAYKEMRAIEAKINKRRRESWRRSDIPLTNFRGIEIRDFRPRLHDLRSSSPSISATCAISGRRRRSPWSCRSTRRTGSPARMPCAWTGAASAHRRGSE